jgi:hypothetical protein
VTITTAADPADVTIEGLDDLDAGGGTFYSSPFSVSEPARAVAPTGARAVPQEPEMRMEGTAGPAAPSSCPDPCWPCKAWISWRALAGAA